MDSSTSKDPLWPNGSSGSRSYDSPSGSTNEGRRPSSGEGEGEQTEQAQEEHCSPKEKQERRQPAMVTPSGIIAQLR